MASISYADVGLNFFSNGLITSTAQIAADPRVVQAMTDATSASFTAARDDPQGAVASMAGRDPQIADSPVLLEQWQSTIDLLSTDNSNGKVPGTNAEEDWINSITVLADAGIIDKAVPSKTITTRASDRPPEYIRPTLAQQSRRTTAQTRRAT